MTEKLTPLPVEAISGNRVDVELPAGSATGINLLTSPHASVLSWTMAPGTEFPPHSHNEAEWIVVVLGGMKIRVDEQIGRLIQDVDGWLRLAAGDYIYLRPGTVHEAVFDVFTEAVSVHIPRSAEYTPCQRPTPDKTVTGESIVDS